MAGFGMKFELDSGSAVDLGKLLEIAESLKKDLPEGDPRPNTMRTILRRIMADARLKPLDQCRE